MISVLKRSYVLIETTLLTHIRPSLSTQSMLLLGFTFEFLPVTHPSTTHYHLGKPTLSRRLKLRLYQNLRTPFELLTSLIDIAKDSQDK